MHEPTPIEALGATDLVALHNEAINVTLLWLRILRCRVPSFAASVFFTPSNCVPVYNGHNQHQQN